MQVFQAENIKLNQEKNAIFFAVRNGAQSKWGLVHCSAEVSV